MMQAKLLACCVVATLALCVYATKWNELDHYTFDSYTKEFSKVYTSTEYTKRKSIFETNLKTVKEHNKILDSSYKMGVNHLTDQTQQEINRLLGYKKQATPINSPYLIKHSSIRSSAPALPTHVDWREKNIVTPVKDQGMCGSCWAFATAQTIESYYAAVTGRLPTLSEQQILDCVPNTNQCGGTGGCGGGTADVAIDKLVSLGGLASEWTYPYVSYFGANFTCKSNTTLVPAVAIVKGIAKLPSNDYMSVMNYLAFNGTLIINVAASNWGPYDSGVYTGCTNSTLDINHVVQLVGYGTDAKFGDYWLVRNSWSPSWGEAGYIRIARTSAAQCGIDYQPMDGTGCTGGPSQVTACGPCGLLYDTSYPVFPAFNY